MLKLQIAQLILIHPQVAIQAHARLMTAVLQQVPAHAVIAERLMHALAAARYHAHHIHLAQAALVQQAVAGVEHHPQAVLQALLPPALQDIITGIG